MIYSLAIPHSLLFYAFLHLHRRFYFFISSFNSLFQYDFLFLLYFFFWKYFSATSILALLIDFVSSFRDLIFLHTILLLLFTISIFDVIVDVSLSREAVGLGLYNACICWSLKRSHAIYSFDIEFEVCSHWFLFDTGIICFIDK